VNCKTCGAPLTDRGDEYCSPQCEYGIGSFLRRIPYFDGEIMSYLVFGISSLLYGIVSAIHS
jgi:hypothetical protein